MAGSHRSWFVMAVVSLAGVLTACASGNSQPATRAAAGPLPAPPPPAAAEYTLTVAISGAGSVISSPAGIDCDSRCTADYPDGSRVTLTANPARGADFVGWKSTGQCSGTGDCVVMMSAQYEVDATFAAARSSPEDPCEGLVQDPEARPMSAVDKPERGASFVDPEFGTTIRRITDVRAQFGASVAKPAYSTIPAWNVDESLLILYVTEPFVGHALFDGRSYRFIRLLDIEPADFEQFYWSSTDPDLLYYPDGRRLIRYHVSSGVRDVLYRATDDIGFGDDPMYSSWDNQVYGITRGAAGYLVRPPRVISGSVAGQPQVAPSGERAIVGKDLYDAQLDKLRPMALDTVEHAAMTRLASGEDVWIAVQYSAAEGSGILAENLQTGLVTRPVDEQVWGYPPGGVHISAHAFRRPGWAAVSIQGDESSHLRSETVLEQELLLVDANTGKVCRVGRHRSSRSNYWSEPHVNISPSGTRLLFGSNWGGGSTVDAYVVELPAYRQE